MLRGLELRVPAGSVVAITGPSGSGKTTLLRVIAGDEPIDAGQIRLGAEIWADDLTDLEPSRRRVAAVPQGGGLLEDRNVGANIALGLPRKVRNSRPGAHRVAEMFDLVGLSDDTAGRRPAQLSISERQRVALARSLVDRPAVLLLDEPFYAFDPSTRHRFRAELELLLHRTATSTVLVTHDDSDVNELADQHHRLVDGRLRPGAGAAPGAGR